ncbi:amidase family protein [Arthrobacter sp. YD4]|uniref:amidase family protein n=1 Tax=Arthrobacter sp. YD4 TaxID=3058043 RepID=UPI0025B2FAAD|nr:amidase family protein [Arthrobacter sp. YD4]MDN3937555.1 amidase family protein [Arthrobacter sp. YD4]
MTSVPGAGPAVAVPDPTVWRVLGAPLVPPTGTGPLDGLSVAVKDLFALEGFAVGAGNPARLAGADPETTTAAAPAALLAAGASVAGIARTDEFAYSLAGTNAHYGTPPNPRAPGRISGGSSSGSASAVSLGQADVGLGTDTGGSIRVPAAYQGLYGIRTSHGAVTVEGLLPLAPSFDTVGWLTRDAATLAAVGEVLLPETPGASAAPFTGMSVPPELLALAEPGIAEAIRPFAAAAELPPADTAPFPVKELPGWLAAFQTVQGFEAWQQHGDWIQAHPDSLGADVAGRFATASLITAGQAEAARDVLRSARQRIRDFVGGGLLVLPSASSVAPLLTEVAQASALGGTTIDAVRQATMQLTCVAGIAGLPALSLPLVTPGGLPCGVSIVGPVHRDLDLLRLARRLGPR